MMKAFIAHTGIISAIGSDTSANLQSLLSAHSGIRQIQHLDTRLHFPAGEVNYSDANLQELAGVNNRNLPRTALLSILAAREAWMPFRDRVTGLRIGFLSANTVGGMDLSTVFYRHFLQTGSMLSENLIKHHDGGKQTRLTMEALGLNCRHATISTACSSSANSIMMGARLIEQNQLDVVIAGGTDALAQFTLNGFNALKILDPEPCRPFNADRQGLNLGEGAAYLVLAAEETLQAWGLPAEIFVSGYANANDAYHQTASSAEGTGNRLAMEGALKKAGLRPEDIDYINLHGTGTENNDSAEGLAIQQLFKAGVPAASSTKTFTGHTLGAAGAVEAVYAYLSLQQDKIWPHLRFQQAMPELNWQPEPELKTVAIRHVLSNSFGFGGNCTTLVFSKRPY